MLKENYSMTTLLLVKGYLIMITRVLIGYMTLFDDTSPVLEFSADPYR